MEEAEREVSPRLVRPLQSHQACFRDSLAHSTTGLPFPVCVVYSASLMAVSVSKTSLTKDEN